jgi:hypothetical protein
MGNVNQMGSALARAMDTRVEPLEGLGERDALRMTAEATRMTDTPETESDTPQLCLAEWCDKPARKLVERGTTEWWVVEPYFCSQDHAEWWAIGVHVEKYGAWWPEWPNPPAKRERPGAPSKGEPDREA